MADYFVAMVPGRPLITTFQQIEPTRVVCSLPLIPNEQINQFGLSLLKPVPVTHAVGVYCCVSKLIDTDYSWRYIGQLNNLRVTDFFHIGTILEDIKPDDFNQYQLHLGITMEPIEILNQSTPAVIFDNNKVLHSAKAIAEDLHRYISSFDKPPTDVMDKWYKRFCEKHALEPYFWLVDKV